MAEEEKGSGPALLVSGVGAGLLGAALTALFLGKPAEAAAPEEKLKYLTDLLEAVVEGQAQLINLLEQLLAAQGVVPPGEEVKITVKTPWVAKTPEQLYSNAIRVAGTFDSDRMVDWTEGKRIIIMVQSSLNQACTIQLVGNYVDDMNLAVDINAALACPANSNISIGPAWDDWHPFIGVRITTAVAPTAGILNIFAVIQE